MTIRLRSAFDIIITDITRIVTIQIFFSKFSPQSDDNPLDKCSPVRFQLLLNLLILASTHLRTSVVHDDDNDDDNDGDVDDDDHHKTLIYGHLSPTISGAVMSRFCLNFILFHLLQICLPLC